MGSQKELFNGQTVINYKTGIYNSLKKAIESMSDEEILCGNFEELT